MSSGSIDLKAQVQAFPFIPPIVPSTGTAATSPTSGSELDQFSNQLEQFVAMIPSDISAVTGLPQAPGQSSQIGNDKWTRFSFSENKTLENLVNILSKQMKTLDNLVTVLNKILNIIGLFINGFNSFSKLIESGLKLVETSLGNFLVTGLELGVFLNVLAPPAFLSKTPQNADSLQKTRGGFDGFITRLNMSLSNPRDKNRPTFKDNDFVGGWVAVVDSESLDTIWSGIKQLAGMFDFLQNFGLSLLPPPPNNFRGNCGFLKLPGETTPEFGVKLEWDQNYNASAFLVSRSLVPGGTKKFVEYVPTTLMDNRLTGEPGLITVAKDWIASLRNSNATGNPLTKNQLEADALASGDKIVVGASFLPEKLETVYDDPGFNNGNPALVKAGFNPTLSYTDLNFAVGSDGIPTVKNSAGKFIPVTEVYYVIQSCDETGKVTKGPLSKELVVTIKTCNDAFNTADVIFHPNARYELLAAGVGTLNNWTSIRISAMAPWISELTGILAGLVSSIKGMVTNASDSFSDFLNQIKAKVEGFIGIINVVSFILSGLKSFVLSPSIAFLELKPVKGGMPVFVKRIEDAKLPSDQVPFSGPDGITLGFVVCYGAGEGSVTIANNLAKAIHFIVSLFTKD